MRHDIISERMERYVYLNSSSLDTPIRIQIPSFYNHENNNKFPISTYAKYVILQRFLTNNFVVVYPSSHVWNELSNKELIASVKSVLCMLAMQEHVLAQNYQIHQILTVTGRKPCPRFLPLVCQQ